MRETTAGQLLLNASLPEEMRDYNRVLDKKGVQTLLDQVARKYPEKYAEIVKSLSDIGRKVAYRSGGFGVGLKSLRQTTAAKQARTALAADLQRVYANRELSPAQVDAAVLETVGKYQKELPKSVFAEAVAANNPLAMQAVSGARGSATNVNSLVGADLLYEDHRGEAVPIPILRNYSMGLSPAEHFAGAFGARKGTLDLKKATADAGFMSKQLAQAAHRLLVTARDDENPYDESQPRGLEVDTDDPDNEGSVLAHPVAGYPRNTVLTPKILKQLKADGFDNILVRSPTVGGPINGGIYAMDAGYRERGGLPPIGDMVGLAGSQAISEPLTQGQISSKHCLVRGTLVRMADWTVKPIEDIVVGDIVLGADRTGATFPVRVLQVFDNGLRECVHTTFKHVLTKPQRWAAVDSTADHKILLQVRDETELQILPIGTKDAGLCAVGYGGKRLPKASSISIGEKPTHDIEVDHPDHLFMLANGLIVSNSGGVAGASAGAIGGFATINAIVQAAESFPGSAVHSQLDGKVESIVEAPQGGSYITVGGERHYAPRGTQITAKPGDTLEAGDVLTAGIPNPSEIVKHKGVGEGRRYFVNTFRQVLKNSQIGAHRRNVELLARGLLNHVRLTDEIGDWGPDDVVPYQTLESEWKPRPGYHVAPPKALLGSYLERPILHYSIGTKIRPSVVSTLDKHGVKSVYAHRDAPPFEPEMVRAMMNTAHDPDWQTKMLGSYQQGSVLEAARRGGVSDAGGTSFVPALAGNPTFGQTGLTKGWNPADLGRKPVNFGDRPQIRSILDD